MIAFFRLFSMLFIFFNFTHLHASGYDEDILNIYAKIMPRLVLMSSLKKNLDDTITICLVSDNEDELFVNSLINKVDTHYPNGIKNYKIKIIKTSYLHPNICVKTAILFLFNTRDKQMTALVKFAKKNKLLTFSYDETNLDDGADISLFLGRKIIPYLNMQSISLKDIQLDSILLRISKIYSKEDD